MPKQPVKLFVDCHSLDHEYQGTYTFIKELYTELLNYDELDIDIVTAKPDRLQDIFPGVHRARILPYKYVKPGLIRYVIDIPRYLDKHNFDYAHFQYIIPMRSPGCKYIVTLHDIIFNDFKAFTSFTYRKSREYLYGSSIKHADIKTTVSDYSRNRIADFYGLDKSKISILNNAIRLGELPTGANKAVAKKLIQDKYGISNFILYVSRIEPRKNHILLLKTYLELKLYEQGIGLVFIGKTSIQVPVLQELIHKLTYEQKKLIKFIEQVNGPDLEAFYRACRLFVYPSLAEGFGIPPLEAAVNLAPVLCSSATAMQSFDFFEPNMFEPNDAAGFKEKLQAMVNTQPNVQKLENIAREIQYIYNWQQTAQTFYNLLK